MSKRKDSEDKPHLPAKRGRHRPGFRVACPRDSSSQRETTSGSKPRASGSTSRITTLALCASDHRLKAKHKERSHTPATATLPITTPPASSSEPGSWDEPGLPAQEDMVTVAPSESAEGAKPKRKRNNNAQVRDFSSMSLFLNLTYFHSQSCWSGYLLGMQLLTKSCDMMV